MAAIVVAFVERLAERDELDLDACGEFLVLIAALLELKARDLFPDEEAELAELEPEEAAEELARRLAEYRRMKEAARWLRERLDAERDRYFRLGPAPSRRSPSAASPRRSRSGWRRRCGGWRSSRRRCRSPTWRCASRPSRSSSSGSARCSGAGAASTSMPRCTGSPASSRQSRSSLCSNCARRARSRSRKRGRLPFAPIRGFPSRRRRKRDLERTRMDRPLRLITSNPVDALARTVEALLVVASPPLSVDELAEAAADDAERIETALGLLAGALPRGARAASCSSMSPAAMRSGPRGRQPTPARGCSSGRSSEGSRRRRSRPSRSSRTSARARGRRSPASAASPPIRPSPRCSSAA